MTESRSAEVWVVESQGEEGQEEGIIKVDKETFHGDGYIHHLDCEMIPQKRAYVNTYKIVLFKCTQFVIHQLYLNI